LILSRALRTALRVEVWELSFCLAAAARRVIDLATILMLPVLASA
jgi:hypothetical protein